LTPDIDATHLLVGVLGPRVVAEFTGPWDGMKHPREFAGPDVECADIAGGGKVALASGAAQDDQVFENAPGGSRSERNGGAIDPRLQIEPAVIRERVHRLAGTCVDRV